MSEISRYPLAWPAGWPRKPKVGRKHGRFSKGKNYITVAAALDRMEEELAKLKATDPIFSSNLRLGLRGDPIGNQREPDDNGVAVYFKLNGKPRVLACDGYTDVASNIAAIAAHIDCIRGIDRYGVGTLDQAFAGYDALPPPGASNRPPWRKVLEFGSDAKLERTMILARYRHLAGKFHPDRPGGSHDAMAQLNEARDEALREIGNG